MLAALIAALANLLMLAFAAGKLHSNAQNDRRAAKSWSDGLGRNLRSLSDREDRRHKQMLSALIDVAGEDDKQVRTKRLTALLRDDSWSSNAPT